MANVPTVSWDETNPAGTQAASLGDDRIRELKTQIREIIDVDHDFPSSGQASDNGQHKQVTLQEQADLGTGAVSATILGSQTVGGKGELTYTDEDDNDIQITSGGSLGAATQALLASTATLSDDSSVAALKKFYLDGGGDTYFIESAANQLDAYAGATLILSCITTHAIVWNGVAIGTNSADNRINDGTGGTGSTTLYAGNETIDTTAVSDISAKKDIVEQGNALDDILKIKVKKYKYNSGYAKDDKKVHTGMIAQDIESLFPETIINRSDGLKSIQYKKLIPFMIKAIQEINTKIGA